MLHPRALLPASVLIPCALALASGCTSLRSGAEIVRAEDAGEDAGMEPPPGAEDGGEGAGDASTEGAPDAELDAGIACEDPQGFAGLGCLRCAGDDPAPLENACADITCTPFDHALRLPSYDADAGLPSLPASTSDASLPSAEPVSAPPCAQLAQAGKALYVTGSSAVRPFLQQVARQFATSGVYVVYTATGSCTGVDALLNDTPMKTGAAPAPATNALVWTSATSDGEKCLLPAEGVTADLGISDVFVQTCPGFELADLEARHVRDTHGPVQTMAFVVPANSRERELSAQAAYFVYGFGADSGLLDASGSSPVFPDETRILQRLGSSGTQALIAAAIGVPPGRFRGKLHRTSDDLAASLLAAAQDADAASQSIGILGVDYIDSKSLRSQIRVLAYRDTHQRCAVYPDSTETARDRRNVRDGHYPLWGPLHLLYRVTDAGVPADARTRSELSDALAYLTGTKALPNGVQLIDLYADSGLVPECAMAVARTSDGGNVTIKQPGSTCACAFEARTVGTTRCTPCTVQGDCAAGETCAHGYCEQ